MTREGFAAMARALKPELHHTHHTPLRRVTPQADASAWQGWRMQPLAAPLQGVTLMPHEAICWDFGQHLTGYLHLKLALAGTRQDAPLRLRIRLGEMPHEIALGTDCYTGWLSAAWLQEEIITIDHLPCEITLPRRCSMRYAQVKVEAASLRYGLLVEKASFDAVTSADEAALPEVSLPEKDMQLYDISVRTLRECMQHFFEDGPKRDRRLWLGDLRLQALTCHPTYRAYGLAQRCLAMFAAAALPSGWLPAAVYDEDPPLDDEAIMVDYALLFGVTLADLVDATGDAAYAEDFFPVAMEQARLAHSLMDENGLFALGEGMTFFIDWKDGLERDAAALGVYLYALDRLCTLARHIGRDDSVKLLSAWVEEGRAIARRMYWDKSRQRFLCRGQDAWATQIWLVLGGVLPAEESRSLMQRCLAEPPQVNPGTPYLKHYLLEALWHTGLKQQALQEMHRYWGRMADLGADTFWEVFDPLDPQLTPYGHTLIHSCCHAWSCTPAYFLLKE